MRKQHIVAPSLLAANFSCLDREVAMFHASRADRLHLDVMDGHFVPNISFGAPIVQAIRTFTHKPFDVHLMIQDPDRYIDAFCQAGADIITVHYEACTHLHRTIAYIKKQGIKAGVALNPHTSVSVLDDIIYDIDLVCVMSVNPGFGGQKFITHSLTKIHTLRSMIAHKNLQTLIEVDGGVDISNASAVIDAGADILVAGSAVFCAPDPLLAIAQLKDIA